MLLSMTGFGRATREIDAKRITVEIKSLNSKQMDLNVRVPQLFRMQEIEMRAFVASSLQRGKADLTVSIESAAQDADADVSMHLNVPVMAAYKKQVEEAAVATGLPLPADWYSVLLRFPDVMQHESVQEANENQNKALREALEQAVDELMRHRAEEGKRLEEFFAKRIETIAELLEQVAPFEHERIDKIRHRLEENISKIPVTDWDKGRLEQEMIFYIEKLDVNEEKQRLAQHLRYFLETMAAPEPGQGKKLGFIAQEMGREINTLGSKSNHADMQRIVVLMKDALEQIKEQVLNVM